MTENIDTNPTVNSDLVKTIVFVTLSTAALMGAGRLVKNAIIRRAKELSDQELIDNINANIATIIND